PIDFEDNHEWNRAILEGQTNPPTLNSEIKYKKRAMLEGSFVIMFVGIQVVIQNAPRLFKEDDVVPNAITIIVSLISGLVM
ncbi:hypothetical protein P7536_15490, partial [Staphylococcus aureus]|nr:hypothetical protein [Staphylococcus aureus]